jgi:hypothetical protein
LRPAEQAAKRQAGSLGEHVPQGDVDGAEHAQQRAAAAEEQQIPEERLPALLDREWIASSKPRRKQLLDPAPEPGAS